MLGQIKNRNVCAILSYLCCLVLRFHHWIWSRNAPLRTNEPKGKEALASATAMIVFTGTEVTTTAGNHSSKTKVNSFFTKPWAKPICQQLVSGKSTDSYLPYWIANSSLFPGKTLALKAKHLRTQTDTWPAWHDGFLPHFVKLIGGPSLLVLCMHNGFVGHKHMLLSRV